MESDSEEKRVRELSEEKFEKSNNAEELNPFGDKVKQEQLTDSQTQNVASKSPRE